MVDFDSKLKLFELFVLKHRKIQAPKLLLKLNHPWKLAYTDNLKLEINDEKLLLTKFFWTSPDLVRWIKILGI